jgi:hypothetical protein
MASSRAQWMLGHTGSNNIAGEARIISPLVIISLFTILIIPAFFIGKGWKLKSKDGIRYFSLTIRRKEKRKYHIPGGIDFPLTK